jgi:hypothetical protein
VVGRAACWSPRGKFKSTEQWVHITPHIVDVTATSYDISIKTRHHPFTLSIPSTIPYNSEATTMFRTTVTRSTIFRSAVAARQLHSSPTSGKTMTEKVTEVADKVNAFPIHVHHLANAFSIGKQVRRKGARQRDRHWREGGGFHET